jgi:hypothetical protein
MDHLSLEVDQQPRQPKKEHIAWRRSRVLELSSQGRTEREIANILRVGAATVGRDLSYLHKQARTNLKSHVQECLPDQYERCSNGLNQVLKIAWNTVLLESGSGSKTNRLQALSLIGDIYRNQMDLVTNSVVVTDAIEYVQGQINHLNSQQHQRKGKEAESESEPETKDKTN